MVQRADSDVLPHADVDEIVAVVVFHQEQAGRGAVVHVAELPPRRARTPYRHRAGIVHLGLVELADERRHDVGLLNEPDQRN